MHSLSLNLGPVLVLTRENPKRLHASPFSSFSTAVCIDPNGVLATAWHNIGNFWRTWTPYDVDGLRRVGRARWENPERHELLFAVPLAPVDEPDMLTLFPCLDICGSPKRDVAVVELGGRGKHRPLPYVRLGQPPMLGEVVSCVGLHHPPNTPLDAVGMPAGFAVSHDSTRVIATTDTHLYLDCILKRGNSGGPVLRQGTWELVGICVDILPPDLSETEVGIRKWLSRAVRAEIVGQKYVELKRKCIERELAGGRSWCSVAATVRTPYDLFA